MQTHWGTSHISIPSTCKGRCTYKHKQTDKAAKDNTVYVCVSMCLRISACTAPQASCSWCPEASFLCTHSKCFTCTTWLRNDYCGINKLQIRHDKYNMFCDRYVLITGCKCLMICWWLHVFFQWCGAAWALQWTYLRLSVVYDWLFVFDSHIWHNVQC